MAAFAALLARATGNRRRELRPPQAMRGQHQRDGGRG
jgi:hypothetical protein